MSLLLSVAISKCRNSKGIIGVQPRNRARKKPKSESSSKGKSRVGKRKRNN